MAIGGQGTSISLPISLEVLQSSVTNLENTLKNLKPESKAFRELERILKSARAEMDRLQVQASKPFGNQQQFNQTEKTIDKIGEALSRAQITIDRIDFKDLKLTDDQQKTFDAFEQQLKNIQQSVASFKNELKGELFADVNFTDVLKEIDPQYASRTFDEIIKVVEEKSQAISNTLEKSREKLKKYQATAQIGIDIEAMQSRAANNGSQAEFEKKAMAALGGNIFEKFFTVDKNDILKFKTNGQEQFVEYLQQQFSLNPQQIEELRKKIGAKAILEKIFATDDNQFFIEQLKNAEKANKDYTKEDTNNKQLIQKSTDVIKIQEELAQKTDLVNQKEKESAAETDNVTAALQQFIAMILEAIRGEKSYSDSLKTGNTELDSFRTTLAQTNTEFLRLQNQRRVFDSIKTGITNFMGFNQVLNLTKRAISEAANHIKSLDTVMNGIAIVTDMTTADLWNQVDAYSKVAQTYGTSIQGAYEVSKIYYQAGYDTADVMTLMNETLKLSKISGLDYATTTDYMMTAMRGFKLEMEDASRVVDVYSNLAAHTAVSQQELAEAMTRTASSMESVGSTFEETSSMIATMVAVTRESASNIGSAMKSIASRYGELTKNPAGFQDLEGEEYSFNKVDQALQSVGISMKDTNGQFRSFTEVILELSDVWNDLTSVQQRYIATQMAGNRQQSRFLALVSNGDLLRENLENALNSEDVGTLQALEYLDSLQAKIEQVQVAYQQFYTTIGIEDAWKSTLGWIKNIIDNLNALPKVFGKLPVSAGIAIANLISVIKNLLLSGLASVSHNWSQLMQETEKTGETSGTKTANKFIDQLTFIIRSRKEEVQSAIQEALTPGDNAGNNAADTTGKAAEEANKKTTAFWSNFGKQNDKLTRGVSILASSLVGLSMAFDQSTESGRKWSGSLMLAGGALQAGTSIARLAYGDITAIPQLISGISSIASSMGILIETTEEKVARLTKEAENLSNAAKQANADERNLTNSIKKVRELEKTRYDSAEAAEEYQAAVEDLADAFPELIIGFDNLGNAVVDVTEGADTASIAEKALANARKRTAEATYDAAKKETEAVKARVEQAQENLRDLEIGTIVGSSARLNQNDMIKKLFTEATGLNISGWNFGGTGSAFTYVTDFDAFKEGSGIKYINGLNNPIINLDSYESFQQLYEAVESWDEDFLKDNPDYELIKDYVITIRGLYLGILEPFDYLGQLYTLIKAKQFDPLDEVQYKVYLQALEEYENIKDDDLKTQFEELFKFSELNKIVENIVGTDAEYVLSYREQIVGWLQTHSLNSDSVITNVLFKKFSNEIEQSNSAVDFNSWMEDNAKDISLAYQQWYNNLSQEEANSLNAIIRDNLSKYSFNQIVDTLSLKQGDGIYEIFEEYYNDRINNIQKLLTNKISETLKNDSTALGKFQDYINESRNNLSANRQSLINDILEHYTKLSSLNKDLSNAYLDSMLSLLRDIDNKEISSEVANVIFGGDLFSVDGINSIIAELDKQELSTDELIQRLGKIRDSFVENYTLSLIAAVSNLSDDWDTISKDITKLRSGVNYFELQKILANADNLSFEDFYSEDGKTYILSLEKYLTYVEDYFDAIDKANDKLSDNELSLLNGLLNNEKIIIDESNAVVLAHIGITGDTTTGTEVEAALNKYITSNKALQDALEEGARSLETEALWLAGEYEQSAKELSEYNGSNARIKAAAKKASDGLYSLLSNWMNRGLEGINFSDYENIGIHNDLKESVIADIKSGISYKEFIIKYGQYLGKTASEIADLTIQAIEKDNAAQTTLTSISTSSRGKSINITSLFTELDDAIVAQLESYGATFANGVLTIKNNADIHGIIQTLTEQAESAGINLIDEMATLSDTLINVIKDYSTLISNGLNGKLTNTEAATLQQFADEYGIDLTFKQTKEGLKISNEEALKLIQALRNLNVEQAQLTFEAYVKSLTSDVGGAYDSIEKVMIEIKRLEEELVKADGARADELRVQLALAKQIALTMTADAKQYSFMDRSLPANMNNPINYWNSVGKAFTAMNTAKSTGYMEIADFYNLVNEMQLMAAQTGQTMEFMGYTINADGTGAAELMEAGLSALANVDGKGVKISLKNMGISVTAGAQDMAKGFEDGIKTFAQSQIDLLDAEIALLEAVVVMENLDLGDDNTLDFKDIFGTEWGDGTAYQASIGMKEVAQSLLDLGNADENLQQAWKDMTFGSGDLTTNFWEMLNNLATGAEVAPETAQVYSKLLGALFSSLSIEDYDLENLASQLSSILSMLPWEDLGIEFSLTPKAPSQKEIEDTVEETQQMAQNVARESSLYEGLSTNGPSLTTEYTPHKALVEKEPEQIEVSVQYSEDTPSSIKELTEATIPLQREVNVHITATGDTEVLDTNNSTKNDTTTTPPSPYSPYQIFSGLDSEQEDEEATRVAIEQANARRRQEEEERAQRDVEETRKRRELAEQKAAARRAQLDVEETRKRLQRNKADIAAREADKRATKAALEDQARKPNTNSTELLNEDDLFSNSSFNIDNIEAQEVTVTPSSIGTTQVFSSGLDSEFVDLADDYDEYLKRLQQVIDESESAAPFELPEDDEVDEFETALNVALNDSQGISDNLSDIDVQKYEHLDQIFEGCSDDTKITLQYLNEGANVNFELASNSLREAAIYASQIEDALKRAEAQSIISDFRTQLNLRDGSGGTRVKGNVALASGRQTLMGELGPELYVTNGRYFVAGQNGAEFVNLPDDAIVFNHIQTKRLLSGFAGGHGKPVTNEYNAISYAKGNLEGGPALASAQAALAQLKQIRAMWDAMLNASLKDLGQKAGGGSGGGGDKDQKTNAAFIADLERWYNLLRQIAKLEKDINYEETLRNKIQSDRIGNGKAIYASLKREIEALNDEVARNKELSYLQKDYYDRRREDLANSNYGKIFTFNEEGLMQYNDQATMANGDRGGLFALAELNQQNPDGSTKYSAKEQYELLKAWGFSEEMRYDNQGKEIVYDKKSKNADDYYTKAVQAFWDKADGWKDELDSLYDSYNEQLTNVLQNEDKRNKLLQQIIDNQLSVEQKVLKAIEDREQAIIDNLQAERDALQEAANAYIDGLSKQLENEKQMYDNQASDEELIKLRRQLAILQRSGGSASQIASLQEQISEKERDAYFEAQQQQIDAIKEASDLEIERLDAQLDLMKESLEYAKKNGLLWAEVAEVMSRSESEISEFIVGNSLEWANKSPLAKSEDLNDLLMEIEQWIEARDDKNNPLSAEATHNWDNYAESAQKRYSKVWTEDNVAKAKAAFAEEYARSSDPNKAGAAADAYFAMQLEDYYAHHPEEDPKRKKSGNDNNGNGNGSGGSGSGGGSKSGTGNASEEAYGWIAIKHEYEGGDVYYVGSRKVKAGTVIKAKDYYRNKPGWSVKSASPEQVTITAGQRAVITIYYKIVTNTAKGIGGGGGKGTQVLRYAGGGLADYTGLAMLHGTKTKPEAVLNAEETKMWREDIMSGKPNSLMSLLLDYRDVLANTANENTYNSITRGGESYTFENVSVNMNVGSIANDYDARRAGQNALEEMLNIARKSNVQSIRR